LIIKDETEDITNRFSKTSSSKKTSTTTSPSAASQLCDDNEQTATLETSERNATTVDKAKEFSSLVARRTNRTQWCVTENQRLYNDLEQLQLAVFCCRQTVGLRTLTWIVTNAKWLETLPNAMQISQALTCVVRANAAHYLAKAAGAQTMPHQALKEYGSALTFLQRDLYNPAKQTSNETLMTVLLLGIFDVQIL
jgi:hypothetical protein